MRAMSGPWCAAAWVCQGIGESERGAGWGKLRGRKERRASEVVMALWHVYCGVGDLDLLFVQMSGAQ